ncbi:hypothetical protein HanPI659440_Chr06g0247691 [Helianthus annuus]|nr:hypothetical protein HanPI659440_Chr06g0247691 [Helianthus annuus]
MSVGLTQHWLPATASGTSQRINEVMSVCSTVEMRKLAPRRQPHQLATTTDFVLSYDNLASRWSMAGDMNKFQFMAGKQERGVWNI